MRMGGGGGWNSSDYRQISPLTNLNSLSNLVSPTAVAIYGMYLRLKLSATPDLKF
jgi:hypothetical protein